MIGIKKYINMSINFKHHAKTAFLPLLENKNAVLTFPINIGVEVDPETGNTDSINSVLTFEAILHHAKSTEVDKFFPGADIVGMKLVGRVVNPKTLPQEIGDRSKGTVEFVDGRRGTVTLYLPPSSAYVGWELGTKIGLLFNENQA